MISERIDFLAADESRPDVRGDAYASCLVDVDDVVFLMNHILADGPEPVPYEPGEADCSDSIDIDDVVHLSAYIFPGGSGPCETYGNGMPDC